MDYNSRDLLINRAKPPFNNIELRRAMALSLARQAFIDILAEGQGVVGGTILPPPDGVWGMPPEVLHILPGYGPDVASNRTEARGIMKRFGYAPDKRLAVKVSTRDVPSYRDAAVIAISQLRETYIDGELEVIDTANWFPRVIRKDYTVRVTASEGGLNEPDQKFYETYVCGADRNYTGYCNDETDRLIDRQSMEAAPERRRKLVWEVERRLAEDTSQPVLLCSRSPGCSRSSRV
jgi:peptide/nickel transport system substrate-binding protein